MVPVLTLKVEIFVGTDIEDAAKEAAQLAQRLNIVVEFDFNTVCCSMHPGGEATKLMAEFRRALRSESHGYRLAVARKE